MSTIFHINSFHRNQDLPNGSEPNSPFHFSTQTDATSTWTKNAPKVTSGSCSQSLGRSDHTITTYVEDWKSSLRLLSIVVPYTAVREVYSAPPDQEYPTPLIYITLTQNNGAGGQCLGITNGLTTAYNEVTFIAELEASNNILDDAGNIIFCIYKPLHSQLVSFVRDRDFTIKIQRQSEGDLEVLVNRDAVGVEIPDTNPANKILQSHLTFQEVPYIRDADFDNHEFELYRS